jgi:hypothetical protein
MVAKRSANELSEARGVGGTIIYQGRGHVLTTASAQELCQAHRHSGHTLVFGDAKLHPVHGRSKSGQRPSLYEHVVSNMCFRPRTSVGMSGRIFFAGLTPMEGRIISDMQMSTGAWKPGIRHTSLPSLTRNVLPLVVGVTHWTKSQMTKWLGRVMWATREQAPYSSVGADNASARNASRSHPSLNSNAHSDAA